MARSHFQLSNDKPGGPNLVALKAAGASLHSVGTTVQFIPTRQELTVKMEPSPAMQSVWNARNGDPSLPNLEERAQLQDLRDEPLGSGPCWWGRIVYVRQTAHHALVVIPPPKLFDTLGDCLQSAQQHGKRRTLVISKWRKATLRQRRHAKRLG